MVRAELKYNPYLNNTEVFFNGKKPHINCMVEKYKGRRLEDWLDKLPDIFRNEMNGYDFELEFSGTKLDYEELKAAFYRKGVTDNDIKFFHKEELKPRETTEHEIRLLMEWLDRHPNASFDWGICRQNYEETFFGGYSLVLLHGKVSEEEAFPNTTVETLQDIGELEFTNLMDTPIVYYVDIESLVKLQEDLKYLMNRRDVQQRQIFFRISNTVHAGKVSRMIHDLGILEPNIISSLTDEVLEKYHLLYPVNDYIHDVIRIFRGNIVKLQEKEKVRRERYQSENKEFYQKISDVEAVITALKMAEENFRKLEKIEIPSAWTEAIDQLHHKIENWEGRKIKTTSESEAVKASVELNFRLHRYYEDFLKDFRETVLKFTQEVLSSYEKIYSDAGEDKDFKPDVSQIPLVAEAEIPAIDSALLEQWTEKYIEPADDFLAFLFKPDEKKKPVLEKTYSFQAWREYAWNTVKPSAEEMCRNQFHQIQQCFDEIARQYQEHLSGLIQKHTKERERISSQLSGEEQRFQKDVDWLASFTDQLNRIAKG